MGPPDSERFLSHPLWPTYDDILDACHRAWTAVRVEAGRIRSLCSFGWATSVTGTHRDRPMLTRQDRTRGVRCGCCCCCCCSTLMSSERPPLFSLCSLVVGFGVQLRSASPARSSSGGYLSSRPQALLCEPDEALAKALTVTSEETHDRENEKTRTL
jgi:hypothetical protein